MSGAERAGAAGGEGAGGMGELNTRAARELRTLRQAHGFTLREVSRRSGVSLTYLSEIERGLGNLSLDLLERLARVYDVDPLALLGGDSGQYARRLVAEARLARIAAIAEEGVSA